MSVLRPRETDESLYRPENNKLRFLTYPFLFIILMWFVFWVDFRFSLNFYEWGILPKHWSGLKGIVFSPVIHGSLTHLSNNTLPILVLGASLYYFYPKMAHYIIIFSWIFTGVIVWFIGRESFHIGASGLIYALAGFIFLSGILRRQPNLLALSLLVVFLYGGLVWGVFPVQENISWEAHLAGASSGFALAIHFRKLGPATKIYSWEEEENEEEDENDLIGDAWKQYGGEHSVYYHYKPSDKKDDTEV